MSRLVVGCMTGTSIDALDAALVRVEGAGLSMRPVYVRGVSHPLGELAPRLRALAEQTPMSAGEIAGLSRAFSLLHASALRELIGPDRVELICAHGQTVYHAPPVSWQLLTPAVIAQALGVPVVSDVRAMDLAAGGQGAPVTPIADAMLFGHLGACAIVNLGGFCNVTMLGDSPAEARGMDVCPCNLLLDTIARRVLGVEFDRDGAAGCAGEVDDEALDDLTGVLTALSASRRSLGTGDEAMSWVGRHRARVSGKDLCATACEAIAQRIARVVSGAPRVVLAGGGVHNAALTRAITSCCSAPVERSDAHGVPASMREAAGFGVLGALCADRVPITLHAVTGVPQPPVSGTWVRP